MDPRSRAQAAAGARPSFASSRCAASIALLLVAATPWLSGCEGEPGPAPPRLIEFPTEASGRLKITYPLDGTLFPPEIVAPTFVWADETEGVARWIVLLRLGDEVLRFPTTTARWRPSEVDWERIKSRTQEADADVAVVGLANGAGADAASSERIRIRTSTDPVGDSIFYREVPLPFIDAVQDPSRIRWRFGSIDSQTAPPIVLEDLPVCGNCHSFSASGSVLGLDVDYGNDKGGYAILPVSEQMVLNDEKIITWSDYEKDDGELTFGLLSQVSPDGRYVISTVKDRAVFVATPEIAFSQLFFPIKGILVVYDTEKKTFRPLPGADDPEYVQSNPTWSPDGNSIVFARAKAYRSGAIADSESILLDEKDVPEFVEEKKPFRFDLYRVPFNEGRGGKAEPLEGASANGKSNYFAKFSPDGKWIVFCKADSYMLLMPDSELFIIPAEGGVPRRLTANTALMNSWHSWSSNGRWLVFSSKVNTPYTQLFLTHIDAEGNDTPPVLLERFTGSDRAANIPEFVPLPAASIAKIQERFLDAYSFLRAGMANERTGNYPGAVRAYNRGLAVEPENPELLNALGFSLFQQGKSDEAVVAYRKALAAAPDHWKAHNNMALASIELGELEQAEAHFRESLAIEPKAAIYSDLGFVLERQGLTEEALELYRKSLELDPGFASAHFNLAAALTRQEQFADAEGHFRTALETKPNAETYNGLGFVLWRQGRADDAIARFREAIEADAEYSAAYNNLGTILIEQGKLEEATYNYRILARDHPSVVAHNKLAAVLVRLGREDEARKELRKALALDPGHELSRENLDALGG